LIKATKPTRSPSKIARGRGHLVVPVVSGLPVPPETSLCTAVFCGGPNPTIQGEEKKTEP